MGTGFRRARAAVDDARQTVKGSMAVAVIALIIAVAALVIGAVRR